MTTLASFVLVGTVMSYDDFLATISFNMNPVQNGGPSLAVLPVEAIPCKIEVGKKIYVVKDESQDVPVISCEKKK
jgi:hypothetical protein